MSLLDLALGRPEPTPHTEAAARAGDPGHVTIYWRDSCPFCARLRCVLRRYRERASWVDIRQDPEGAAYVRTTNPGGDEIVPTVVIDGVAHPNPAPGLVLDALRRRPAT